MEMKYYNPSNNFRAPIPREPKPYVPEKPIVKEHYFEESKRPASVPEVREIPPETVPEKRQTSLIKRELNQDDLLILGLIFLLLINSCEDYLLLFALGFLFFSGHREC